MGAAAGAAVRPGEGDDADVAGDGLLAAVVDGGKLFAPVELDVHGMVFPEVAVGGGLHFLEGVPGDVGVIVDGDEILPHVEAHVVAGEAGAEHPGDDVLAAVLLHVVKAAVPVDGAGEGGADLHRGIHGVENRAVFFLDIQHLRLAQGAEVAGLAAALRVEGAAVQGHEVAILAGVTSEDPGGEGFQVGVGVVEFFRGHGGSSFR